MAPPDGSYLLTISDNRGRSAAIEVDEGFAARLWLEAGFSRANGGVPSGQPAGNGSGNSLPRYAATVPRDLSYVGKIVAVLSYLDPEEPGRVFRRSDLRRLFRGAVWPAPADWGREIRLALEKYGVLSGTSEAFSLTEKGRTEAATGYIELRSTRGRWRAARQTSLASEDAGGTAEGDQARRAGI